MKKTEEQKKERSNLMIVLFELKNLIKQGLLILSQLAMISLVYTNGFSKMIRMTDSQLNEITGGGFSKVQMVNDGVYDIARMQFNVNVETYTEIDSWKMGYWDNGNGIGWDQDWIDVDMGSGFSDLKLNGFIFEAKFENIDDAATRELVEVRLGFQDVVGTLKADFRSLSRLGALPRQAEGVKTYTFNHDPLILTIKCKGQDAGIWFDFGGAQGN
ncbi:hypothetical protein JCM12298_26080 [Desulfothermus naphthae]